MLRYIKILLLICTLVLADRANLSHAGQVFKIASLAPAGSIWVEQFAEFAKEVNQQSNGAVRFKVYPGGVMGDDKAMLRKMRVGQLHGGGFTMTGISTVVPDFRVMAIPFLFSSYDEVDHVRDGLLPLFREEFRKKGMELIAMTEVGFIYAMSTQKVATLQELQDSKNWSPAGDPVSEAYLKALNITPVQLTIPDVLSSLQSGLIDTVYNSLYGSIVLQWFTKANNIINLPYGYAYGAFALSSKKYNKLSQEQKDIIAAAANRHFSILLAETRKSNQTSRAVLRDHGATFVDVDQETAATLSEKRDVAIQSLIPNSLSSTAYERAAELLRNYREKNHSEKPEK